jgi:hypothetical protein
VAAATRRGRFGEYNYRCACIAQLVEQLTLNQRTLVDAGGRLATDSNQLSRIRGSVRLKTAVTDAWLLHHSIRQVRDAWRVDNPREIQLDAPQLDRPASVRDA